MNRRGGPPAAARRVIGSLKHKVVGPGGKTYWVTQHKDEFGYAKKFKENLYDPSKDQVTDTGYFITPDGKDVIIVDPKQPERWYRPHTKYEHQQKRELLHSYHTEYGPDAVPHEHFNKISMRKRANHQRQREQGHGQGHGQRLHMHQEGQHERRVIAVQNPQQHQAVHYHGKTPEQVQMEVHIKLFRRHNIKFNMQLYQAYKSRKIVRICCNNLVKIASVLDRSPLRFPTAEQLKVYSIDQFRDALGDFVKQGLEAYAKYNVPVLTEDWEYLECAVHCAEELQPKSKVFSNDMSLKIYFDLLHKMQHLQSFHESYAPMLLQDMRDLFDKTAAHVFKLLDNFNRVHSAAESQKIAAAAADNITHQKSGGDVNAAMDALVDRVERDENTPVLKNDVARIQFYKRVISTSIPYDEVKNMAADKILHAIVSEGKLPLSYFEHCCKVSEEFKAACYFVRNPSNRDDYTQAKFGFGGGKALGGRPKGAFRKRGRLAGAPRKQGRLAGAPRRQGLLAGAPRRQGRLAVGPRGRLAVGPRGPTQGQRARLFF